MGEVFAGRFQLLDPIAEGAMGSVWQVLDLRDGQVYAGKVLRQSDAGSLLRFMREQSTRVTHPHVVTPLSWAGEDDRLMFSMPLLRGGSVADLIRDFGPLPASWVATLLDQVLQALQAVHTAGIVHRDVKPANLLLEATGVGVPHLRLTDFGVAMPMDAPRLTEASFVVGTPGYVAPDYLTGNSDPEPAHDLHAVATVGLELVSGVRPPGAADAALARASAEPPLAPLVSLLNSVYTGSRPPSAAAFRSALAALDIAPVIPNSNGPSVLDRHPVVSTDPSTRSAPTVVRPRSSETKGDSVRRSAKPTRIAGLALVLVGLACALGAIALLLA